MKFKAEVIVPDDHPMLTQGLGLTMRPGRAEPAAIVQWFLRLSIGTEAEQAGVRIDVIEEIQA